VLGCVGMRSRVTLRRIVAASNVSALSASAQVKPPTVFCEAFHTAGTGRFSICVYAFDVILHQCLSRDPFRGLFLPGGEGSSVGFNPLVNYLAGGV
jgi:hypothetical protein